VARCVENEAANILKVVPSNQEHGNHISIFEFTHFKQDGK
jgi:hypothetical protein